MWLSRFDEQREAVEHRDRGRGVEQQVRQAAAVGFRLQRGAQPAEHDEQPDAHAGDQQHIHRRPSSRYSQPCVPSHHQVLPSMPLIERYSPVMLPTTTITSAREQHVDQMLAAPSAPGR